MDIFLNQEHTVSSSKFMAYVFNLYEKLSNKVIYRFHTVNFKIK